MKKLSYKQRGDLTHHPVTKQLFYLMEEKKTNLALAADVTRAKELLQLADLLGPEICIFKTHIDILQDFTPAVVQELTFLAGKHQFLLFEDRKFADGKTAVDQYKGGLYHIVNWAHMVSAEAGVVEELRKVGLPKKRGVVLVDDSSEVAEQYHDFVMGFFGKGGSSEPTFVQIGGDVLVIGQEIYAADDVQAQARYYREKGWTTKLL